ncbi:SH3 domain-containing protein [Chryseobacterium mucoviscidosis]|uniref:SH3 domain-containing protein n=1 Tax=Chryseobacterium mucoviscidosis TaxID=1945581 RepID=UPI0031CF9D66
MKKLIPFIIIAFGSFLLNSCFKANDSIGHEGRCTGSANCTACSNCSRCGHCSSGGTCGVCGGGSSESYSSGRSSTRKRKIKKHTASDYYTSSKTKSNKPQKIIIDEVNVDISSNRYITGIATTNIYEKPFLSSKVVTRVYKNEKLIPLSKEGSWYKVKVKSSRKKGYVFYKDVK